MGKAQSFRLFTSPSLIGWVKVGIGPEMDREWRKFDVDPTTGVIAIPDIYLPAYAETRKKFENGRYAQVFEIEVSHETNDDTLFVVAQRGADNAYKRQVPAARGTLDLLFYNFPPCSIARIERTAQYQRAERKQGPTAIFTTPKSQGDKRGVNRVDTWVFTKSGFIGLFQILVTSFDDGRTFRLVGEWRWKGTVKTLYEPRPYLPQLSEKDKPTLYSPRVREVIDHLIFVPDGSLTGIDNRAEVLENQKVLNFLEDHMHEFERWAAAERNFSIVPDIEGIRIQGPNRGFLKWFSHAMGSCGMGIVVGADGVDRQVRYHCFGDVVMDEQAMIQLSEGDVIEWDDEVPMGNNPSTGKPYPKLIGGATVQLVNWSSRSGRRAKGITAVAA